MQAPLQRPPPARLPAQADEEPRGRVHAWGRSDLASNARSLSRDAGRASAGQENDKKSNKPKDLSHVPCKFFKASSCTAGKSCPFSHDLTVPGTTKPICQWYAKGNCKFGHKCALAHILPGQPMSFDRKNKRAAQAALREAQAAGGAAADASASSTSPPAARSPPAVSGIARSLGRSSELSTTGADQTDWSAPTNGHVEGFDQQQSQGALDLPLASNGSHNPAMDVFGSSSSTSSSENGPLRPFPQHQSFSSLSATPPASSFLSSSSPPVTLSPSQPSGLSQTLAQQFGNGSSSPFGSSGNSGGNRNSVAAQVMLSAQSRRPSNNGADSLSPPRPSSTSRPSFSSDLPNAIPASSLSSNRTSPSPGQSLSIFGTSPFSNSANSRALFMPSSYDSNEDHFPRSPPGRVAFGGLAEMRRSSSNGWARGDDSALGLDGLGDDEDDGDESRGGGAYDEGFLPSSLNDLLTPEEQRRRSSKLSFGTGGGAVGTTSRGFDPFAGAKSVPAEMMLARGRPTLASSASAGPTAAAWGTLSASVVGTNPEAQEYTPSFSPPAPASRSLLSGIAATSSSPSASSSLLLPRPTPLPSGVYSSSFDARSFLPHHQTSSPSYASRLLSSSTDSLPLAAPSSLPGGLAAGLSQLHLIPPQHTGNTPPTSSSLLSARGASSATAGSPARAPAWGGWGSPNTMTAIGGGSGSGESPRTFAAAAAAGAAKAVPRRLSSHQPQQPQGIASPLRTGAAGSAGSEEGDEEEIQFSMDT